ncbi:uncharacterized protein I303_105915 [Kwoniella dejecticola CBS 10117]|uniref:Uncharacterized protein n=1 Tax=Kwoniella dejecticola CBS 10117 TaxID=1296121 RepID=A0A1A6A0T1_9TREE|nr:uncharacterized protein I303_05938 [Kwoniella dejecticola CBS 10117]OBR83658.1 hypothetical protein I303_05938 [Kwoniella dejecticola CBS 10117]
MSAISANGHGPRFKPLPPVSVTFLGTSSGGGPILSRNCSSLAVDFGNEIWLFDAADGTLMRLHQSSIRIANISRMFITHMHADHVLGVVAIMMTIMSGVGVKPGENEQLAKLGKKKTATFHIYGPAGIRNLIRTTLKVTSINLAGVYAVHEILEQGEAPSTKCEEEDLHSNEAVGVDFVANEDGVWEDILQQGNGKGGKGWSVKAGPIHHRVPSLGYILEEPTPRVQLDTATLIPLLQSNAEGLASLDPPIKHPLSLLSHLTSLPPPPPYTLPSGDVIHPPQPSGVSPRKLVIFGDCSGGTENPTFQKMCAEPSLLVHECTNGHIPYKVQRGDKGMKIRKQDLEPSLEEKRDKLFFHKQPGSGIKDKTNGNGSSDESFKDDEKRRAIQEKAISRGHSTPEEVGTFAKVIKAKRVIINHFSAMFPSPHYASSQPFPSILSPISPHPYPSPFTSTGHGAASKVEPHELTKGELHTRLIMQSLADQITDIWTSQTDQSDGQGVGEEDKVERMAIPSRDFMNIRIPSHELSEGEQEEIKAYRLEVQEVMISWKDNGGVWVPRDRDEGRVWLGVDRQPAAEPSHIRFEE